MSTNQPTSQPINQPINQSINQSISRFMIDRSIKQGSKKQEINIYPVGRFVRQSGVTQSVIHVPDIDFQPLISKCIIVIAIFV